MAKRGKKVEPCGGMCCALFGTGFDHEVFEYMSWSVRICLRLWEEPQVAASFWVRQNKSWAGEGRMYDFDDCRKMMLAFVPHKAEGESPQFYTCKVWDKKTKLCTEYEQRPIICRNHGVKMACAFSGCKLNPIPKKVIHEDNLG